MKKKILIALSVIAGLIAVFLIVVALQPGEYQVSRSATIDAPPAAVFAHVNDLHQWEEWSPWAKLDPNAKNTFTGPESGKGAVFAWAGNDEVGEGKMTITTSQPPEKIELSLEFVKPFADQADVGFTFEPEGEKTNVTWSMHGENNFIEKGFCLFMDMEKMIGEQYEKGLVNLKKVVESGAKTPAAEDQDFLPNDEKQSPEGTATPDATDS